MLVSLIHPGILRHLETTLFRLRDRKYVDWCKPMLEFLLCFLAFPYLLLLSKEELLCVRGHVYMPSEEESLEMKQKTNCE